MPAQTAKSQKAVLRLAALAAATFVAATALVTTTAPLVSDAAPGGVCTATTSLVNGDFEQPAIAANSYSILDPGVVPGWNTTDTGIEIWSSGFNGTPAQQGAQFAEINANNAGMLYQDVATTPGQTLRWSLLHRARVGTDVMEVLIGAPGGSLVSQGSLSDDTSAWGAHEGLYVVPTGQTTTRFGFNALSTGSGSASVGNFLDDVTFGTGACLVTSTTMTNVTAPGVSPRVGDVIEYTVAVENQGGSPATGASIVTGIPAGTQLVSGSVSTDGGARTDGAGDDPAEQSGSTVVARVGSGANAATGGSIAPAAAGSVTYRVVVLDAAALTTITVAPQVTATDSLAGTTETTAAPQVSAPIPAAADLSVASSLSDVSPVAGGGTAVTWTSVLSNDGPQSATNAVATITVPAELAGAVVTINGVPCPISAGVATCAVSTLALGTGPTITMTGTVGASVAAGTALTGAVSFTSDVYDPSAANAQSSLAATVQTSADLAVEVTTANLFAIIGDTVQITVGVTNHGPSDAAAAAVVITAPTGMSVMVSAGSYDSLTGVWTIGALPVGASADLVFTTVPADDGTIDVSAQVSSATSDPDYSNDQDELTIVVAEPLIPSGVSSTPPASNDPVVSTTSTATTGVSAASVSSSKLASTGTSPDGSIALALLGFGAAFLIVGRRRRRNAAR